MGMLLRVWGHHSRVLGPVPQNTVLDKDTWTIASKAEFIEKGYAFREDFGEA